jgi:hypothetical protein
MNVYLFYLDESGDPSGFDDADNFVLAGVAVHEGQVRRLSQQVDHLQREFFPDIHVPLEFHPQHIYAGKGRFRPIPKPQRVEMLRRVCNLMAAAGFPNLIAFASAIHVSSVADSSQILRSCLEDICECFNAFLVRQYKAGFKDKGLLIMDRSGRESRVREIMADFERRGTKRGYLGNITDVPYFAESNHTRMLQLADSLAFAVGRYVNAADESYLAAIWNSFDSNQKGKFIGLRHITSPSFSCKCRASHIHP